MPTREALYVSMPIKRAWGMATKRSEEHTSELQSQSNLVCRLLLEKKKKIIQSYSLIGVHFTWYLIRSDTLSHKTDLSKHLMSGTLHEYKLFREANHPKEVIETQAH